MEERRRYQRIYAQKHANGYDYGLELDGYYYKAKLVDVSQGGARLQLEDEPGVDLYEKSGVVKDDYYDQPYIEGVNYTVVWAKNYELGISFSTPLDLEYGTLYLYYGNA
jgi:c-di-GMP-binding flagellar brake protein YcgR